VADQISTATLAAPAPTVDGAAGRPGRRGLSPTATSPLHPPARMRPIAVAVIPTVPIEPFAGRRRDTGRCPSRSSEAAPGAAARDQGLGCRDTAGRCCAVTRLYTRDAVGIAVIQRGLLGYGVAPVAVVATGLVRQRAGMVCRPSNTKVMERICPRTAGKRSSPRGPCADTAPAHRDCRCRCAVRLSGPDHDL